MHHFQPAVLLPGASPARVCERMETMPLSGSHQWNYILLSEHNGTMLARAVPHVLNTQGLQSGEQGMQDEMTFLTYTTTVVAIGTHSPRQIQGTVTASGEES